MDFQVNYRKDSVSNQTVEQVTELKNWSVRRIYNCTLVFVNLFQENVNNFKPRPLDFWLLLFIRDGLLFLKTILSPLPSSSSIRLVRIYSFLCSCDAIFSLLGSILTNLCLIQLKQHNDLEISLVNKDTVVIRELRARYTAVVICWSFDH